MSSSLIRPATVASVVPRHLRNPAVRRRRPRRASVNLRDAILNPWESAAGVADRRDGGVLFVVLNAGAWAAPPARWSAWPGPGVRPAPWSVLARRAPPGVRCRLRAPSGRTCSASSGRSWPSRSAQVLSRAFGRGDLIIAWVVRLSVCTSCRSRPRSAPAVRRPGLDALAVGLVSGLLAAHGRSLAAPLGAVGGRLAAARLRGRGRPQASTAGRRELACGPRRDRDRRFERRVPGPPAREQTL